MLRVYALINDIHRVSLLLELVVGHHEVLEEGASLASHVLHQVLGHKTEVFFYLLDQSVAVLEIQVSETQDFLEVVGHEFAADVQSLYCVFQRLALEVWSDVGGAL